MLGDFFHFERRVKEVSSNNGNRMYSRAEAALLLGISVPTLDRRIVSGKLEVYKDGSRVLIDDEQIEAYKSKHRVRGRKVRRRSAIQRSQLAN